MKKSYLLDVIATHFSCAKFTNAALIGFLPWLTSHLALGAGVASLIWGMTTEALAFIALAFLVAGISTSARLSVFLGASFIAVGLLIAQYYPDSLAELSIATLIIAGLVFTCTFLGGWLAGLVREWGNGKLREHNQSLQNLLGSLNDGFFQVDRQGRFVKLNEKAAQLLGCRQDALLGRMFQETFPGWMVGDFAQASCDVLEYGVSRHFEAFFEPLNIWCRVNAYPMADGVYVFFSDVTESFLTLQMSQETETRLRLTQEVACFADWQFDIASNELILSQQAEALLCIVGSPDGTAAPGNLKSALLRRLHPDDRLMFVSSLLDIAAGKKNIDVHARMVGDNAGGKWRDFHFIGEVVESLAYPKGRLVGCMQDVSEQKKTERRLMDAEAYANSIINAVPQPFCVLDEDGDIISVNQAWNHLFTSKNKWQPWAEAGSSYLELCRRMVWKEETNQCLISGIQSLLSGVGDPFSHECHVRLDEEDRVFKISAASCATNRRRVIIMHEEVSLKHDLHKNIENSESGGMVGLLPHDYALLQSAGSGYQCFTAALGQDRFEPFLFQGELDRALQQREFILHYQPQLDLKTRKIRGAEALIRWQHPVHGLISPLRFIPLLEKAD
jgi:PAS domain S-box-containing protein